MPSSKKSTWFIILSIAIVVLVVSLWPVPSPILRDELDVKLSQRVPIDAEGGTAPQPPLIPFSDITRDAGVDFVHQNGATSQKLLPETMGSGAAFFDYDNDGDQDLLLINAMQWTAQQTQKSQANTSVLYQNDGTGRFTDVTQESGLDIVCYGTGVAVGDYDNDGWQDLFIAAVGADHLFHNDAGHFTEVTQAASVAASVVGADKDYSSSCGWLDYDNDGDLDLFVCQYVDWSPEADLAQEFSTTGGERDYGPPLNFGGTFPRLYRNEGDGRFSDVSAAAGFNIRSPSGGPMAKSLGVAPVDLDEDGWLDLIVANDTVRNFLFHNQQDGTFKEIGVPAGIAFDNSGGARGAMGIDTAKFRNNALLGVGIGNFANEMTALYVSQQPLLFFDEANVTGIGAASLVDLTFGLFFFDADLDGRLDLLAANGHVSTEISRVQTGQTYAQPPRLFWNSGAKRSAEFVPLSEQECGKDFLKPLVGRAATYADIDADGDVDILITTSGGSPRLLRNDQNLGHHWIRFKLIGTDSNRDAIGSRVEIDTGEQKFSRQVMPTRSYLSQVELPVTFGLGDIDHIDEVVIRWPDGILQRVPNPQVDRLHTIRQSPQEQTQE